ncbi:MULTISPECIES: ankyrin repeat domain-containing protein [unclassified Aeromonas]|uniref:ankyrin repeat domain-containing protein n=1 Tax=unclassified Aeromonas TaxID=257493 RepID=UPI00209AA53F|nr:MULTISPECIES: ankyrin repeat domain-containing protein [unclassified Aeromonas]
MNFWGIVLSMLFACQVGGKSLQASEFFPAPVVSVLDAILRGDETTARRLIAQGVDLNIRDTEPPGATPLLWLINTKDEKAIQLALKLGADPNFKFGTGGNCVAMVAGSQYPNLLRIMLDAGGDPNSLNGDNEPALFNAVGMERWADIKLLVERGADINLTDGPGRNSALYGAYIDKYEVVYWLLQNGADYNVRDSGGSDLALSVEDSLSLMDKSSPQYPWALKVKQFLIDKGIKFPPLTPAEVRERWARGEKI